MKVQVTVLNWDKYNRRSKDINRPFWFSMSNSMVEDPEFYDFSGDEFKAWIYVLSQASKKGQTEFWICSQHAEGASRIPPEAFASSLEKLQKLGHVLVLGDRAATAPRPYRDRTATATEQNRTEQDTTTTVVDKSTRVVAVVDRRAQVFEPRDESELVCGLSEKTRRRWAALYHDEVFCQREIIKAFGYYENNPRKKPKTVRGWTQALSSWLERSWTAHVRSIPGQRRHEPRRSSL